MVKSFGVRTQRPADCFGMCLFFQGSCARSGGETGESSQLAITSYLKQTDKLHLHRVSRKIFIPLCKVPHSCIWKNLQNKITSKCLKPLHNQWIAYGLHVPILTPPFPSLPRFTGDHRQGAGPCNSLACPETSGWRKWGLLHWECLRYERESQCQLLLGFCESLNTALPRLVPSIIPEPWTILGFASAKRWVTAKFLSVFLN
jgi:hypothetical protein